MPTKHMSFSDQPTTQDELGFSPFVKALLTIVNGIELEDTPLTIGIFGPWGSGKTSLMRMIFNKLQPDETNNVSIWFDAWRYGKEDDLWRALLISIVEGLRQQLVEKE